MPVWFLLKPIADLLPLDSLGGIVLLGVGLELAGVPVLATLLDVTSDVVQSLLPDWTDVLPW